MEPRLGTARSSQGTILRLVYYYISQSLLLRMPAAIPARRTFPLRCYPDGTNEKNIVGEGPTRIPPYGETQRSNGALMTEREREKVRLS